jgi:uncharacterized protein YbaR (Trm112 family)
VTIACPSCAAPMQRRGFERKALGVVELDLCFTCKAIWFDQFESAQLAPGAIIELFGEINAHEGEPPRALGSLMRCPTCHDRLALTQDIQRTNRISYYRCPASHGRFTTFLQFLREKNFVRTLTAPEITQLRVTVAQVRCSSCGAPVDLGRDPVCPYCHSPISILDADAVKRTLAELSTAERARHNVDPTAVMDGLLAGKRVERKLARVDPQIPSTPQWAAADSSTDLVDLVGEALNFLMSEWRP